jgi:hypothetical protein
VLLSLWLALGLVAIPTARVAACSCAFTELPHAIRDADHAFVGTLIGTDRAIPSLGEPTMDEIAWTWIVERSRDPISASQASVAAWPDNGANCGVAFGIDERWLVLAHLEDGRLVTNGCMPNHRMDGSDPDTEAIIDGLVTASVSPVGASTGGSPLPVPLLVALAGVALMVAASVWAFRRAR